MNKKAKDFFIKYFIPSLIVFIIFLIDTYLTNNNLTGAISSYIIIFLFILFLVTMFWSFLYYFQETVGEVMKKGTVGMVVFILVALVVIYMYKSTGKI
ncbi:hypothetical protein H3N56_12450 [Cetobacterium sp. 2A]|uniref:hypothetical protein n=1 Tax=Cetobacterium sp. 2A TaxID=2754723 RepID=UPI00163C3F56|nr:hypothetical protein [Cetobacterium sp. 2A]MBC2857243.1 hypothetical protein [Cetobacterium sp. 2A]